MQDLKILNNQTLNKEVQYIKGVGPTRAKLLNKLGINTLEDLITYYPRTYENRGNVKAICELQDGDEALIEAVPVARMTEARIRKNMTIYKLIVRDETGTCLITWFNQFYLKNKFEVGEKYKFFGKVSIKGGKIEMASPVFDEETSNKNTGRIIPIYPLTANLAQNAIRKIIENGLQIANNMENDDKTKGLEETLPQYIIDEYKVEEINKAINDIHFPESFEDFEKARKRLVFEELLSMQLGLICLKNKYDTQVEGIQFSKDVHMSDVIEQLPFKLTKAQIRVLEEIDNDMEQNKPMNRLLQGDVGSRKNCRFNSCSI